MRRLKSWTRYLALAAVSFSAIGARPSAEIVLQREPGALLDQLVAEKVAVVQGGEGDGPEWPTYCSNAAAERCAAS